MLILYSCLLSGLIILTSTVVLFFSHCRASIKEQEYLCHAYVRADKLVGVLLSDAEYPSRVAHNLLTRVLDDFSSRVPSTEWPRITENSDPAPKYKGLDEMLTEYQDPKQADALFRIQGELDETKVILHDTIEAVLNRSEKLEDLVSISEDLDAKSKMSFPSTQKMNKCCSWI